MPLYTYVSRSEKNQTYESKLQRALDNTGTLISITGASKVGKTVLCNKVVGPDKIINISGAQLQSQGSFWEQIYEKLDIPVEYQSGESDGMTSGISGSGSPDRICRHGRRSQHLQDTREKRFLQESEK